ncbi:hypothetical protein EXIGLDRAFT_721628 [Exidia glandulosa HHB12029]|uniref:Uncharacterized protein n=1 Tax=Exidia glandulosa HHB12029 TaxID=1314781 RepID=A0A165FKJ1_EXIGL|nr:hypothetical protein EXIGLDRAFT_721628 [Exidia glandulosa HHB12029]
MASLPTLTPPRRPTRVGSLSPNSIPSSPTSVHSSSSAIFERDIEPLPSSFLGAPAPQHHPHRTPRSKATEPIDAGVPSVLSAAASALASAPSSPQALAHPNELDPFVVIAPTAQITSPAASVFGSPSGRASREQSPSGRQPRRSSTAASERMSIAAASFSPQAQSQSITSSSPPTSYSPPISTSALPIVGNAEASTGPASNRLSFISYNDLLLSAPVSAVPLSTLTSPATSDPPPHLSAVSGSVAHSPARSRPRSIVGLGPGGNRASILLGDDHGGEWEREGLGRGLEERLEELLKLEAQTQTAA